MKIGKIRSEQIGERTRFVASVCWEDCDRAPLDLYFETEVSRMPTWPKDPHAFLVACLLPAWHHGEQRIALDEPICPELRANLEAALALARLWWPGRETVRIEAKAQRPLSQFCGERKAGLFLSGGIDSLASLRLNRQQFSDEHPRRIQVGILVHGFDIGLREDWPQQDLYQQAYAGMTRIAQETDLALYPVCTNARRLFDDPMFFAYHYHSSMLASIGHAFAEQLGCVNIASGDNRKLLPWGSHPVLDPLFSSETLRIRHDGAHLTRLEKTALVADWPVALENLRVCMEVCWDKSRLLPEGYLNCGRCEKCVRTMLHLLVCGKLAECKAFDADDVTPEMVAPLLSISVNEEAYECLPGPLTALGRMDLASLVRRMRRNPIVPVSPAVRLKRTVGKIDRALLGGRITNAVQRRRDGSSQGRVEIG